MGFPIPTLGLTSERYKLITSIRLVSTGVRELTSLYLDAEFHFVNVNFLTDSIICNNLALCKRSTLVLLLRQHL